MMRTQHLLLFLMLVSLAHLLASFTAAAQSCSGASFSGNRAFVTCNDLPRLGASLHWTYHAAAGTADIAYRAPQSSSGWVAWALNPTGTGMLGAQALIAFPDPSTPGGYTLYTTSLPTTGYAPTVANGSLSFPVFSRSVEYSRGAYTIYATIGLPKNGTRINQVWQAGTVFNNGVPNGHATTGDNVLSTGSLDLLSGVSGSAGGIPRLHKKNAHGILNAVSWGILMPTGVIISRYMRVFESADPAWFYLHMGCQCTAYVLGVAGWGTGLKLGSDSKGITYHSHRNIGIALFCFATLQVFALLLRPNKKNKYRVYWNVYHHSVGYSVIVLSIINIFKGFDILNPDNKWKHAYIGIIASLGGVAVVLEAITWGVVLKRRSRSEEKSHHGANGANGYGARQNQGA